MTTSQPVDSWVQCDRCNKWRRIPTEAAQRLADDAPWYASACLGALEACHATACALQPRTMPPSAHHLPPCRYCEMNEGSIYNDCDVPQELTDQQIDHLHEEEVGRGRHGQQATLRPAPCSLAALGAGPRRSIVLETALHSSLATHSSSWGGWARALAAARAQPPSTLVHPCA